jgi:TPP-dependent indolepyruvate ferredoxin oxidoreductase alpha subunit
MAKVLMKGNEAIGEAAIRAGCLNYFAYPITPQSEVAEYLSARMPEVGGVFSRGRAKWPSATCFSVLPAPVRGCLPHHPVRASVS